MATVPEIKAALDERGIDYPSDARKADLETLLETGGDGPQEPSGDAPAPSGPRPPGRTPRPTPAISDDLAKARDAARKVEASTRISRVRPAPATIDPRLVEVRDATRAADAASVRTARDPIDRS